MRAAVAAGEPLDPDALGAWREATNLWIRDGYGQTETGQLTGMPLGIPARPGSMGIPLPGIRLDVDDGELAPRGYTTVYGGDRYPYHGHFVPGDANSIGFEDVVTIEDFAFLSSVARGEQHEPGIEAALAYVGFQAAWLRSCSSGRWEDVVPLEVPA